MRRLTYWIGTTLLAVGLTILLVSGALYGYGEYERIQADNEIDTATPVALAEPQPIEVPTNTPEPTPPATSTSAPIETPAPGVTEVATPEPATPTATSTPEPTVTPTPIAEPQIATRIRAPAIKLDAPIKESIVSSGQWIVPKFAAGHLQGTAAPGEPGNSVYAGHISSISSGDVFASIGNLAPGDVVTLVTQAGELKYQVAAKLVVKNTDLSVTKDFGDERITLITCTGTWLPLQHDFNQRLVVVAMRLS